MGSDICRPCPSKSLMTASYMPRGTYNSGLNIAVVPVKPSAAIPTTVKRWPFTRSVLPGNSGSAPVFFQ